MLANRLSENSESRVLLLEAGPDDRGETDLSVPMNTLEVAFSGSASPFNWAFSTEPQKQALAAYSEQVFDKPAFSCTTAVVDRNDMLLSIRSRCEFTLCVDPAAECLRTLSTFKLSGCEDGLQAWKYFASSRSGWHVENGTLSDEEHFAFMKILQSHQRICDFSMEDYHNRNRARKGHTSNARKWAMV